MSDGAEILKSLTPASSPRRVGRRLREAAPGRAEVRTLMTRAMTRSRPAAEVLAKGYLATAPDAERFVEDSRTLVEWGVGGGAAEKEVVAQAILGSAGEAGELVLLQNISGMVRGDARPYMRAYLAAGGSVGGAAHWLQLAGKVLRRHQVKPSGTAEVVVDAVGDAAQWVVDAVEDGVDAILEGIEAIVDALVEAGIAIATVVAEAANWTVEQLTELIGALLEAGIELGSIMISVFAWTYDQAANFVRAALDAGLAVADLMMETLDQTYFAMRRIVNGLFAALGGVGDVLDWALSQLEVVGSAVFRSCLLALRFAGAVMTEVLDWMLDLGSDVIETVLWAWESIGEALITVYQWAATVGVEIWESIGEVTVRLGNNVYYVLNYITDDFIPGMFNFVRGCLRAGFAIRSFVAWAVEQTLEVAVEVTRALLDMGATLAEMLAEVIQNPAAALTTFLAALRDLGTSLEDIFQAVIVDTAEEFLEEAVETLLELGEAAGEILDAIWEIEMGRIGLVIALLFNRIPGYRPLTDAEIDDARTVFGDSLNYETIFVSRASVSNDIIFAIQDFFARNRDSRAFVTGRLINFDVTDRQDPDPVDIDRATMIHELTHVWQHDDSGPLYLADALAGQQPFGAGYNYGYSTATGPSWTIPVDHAGTTQAFTNEGFWFGVGGEGALTPPDRDLDFFNREQQGQILMHWFVRTQLPITDTVTGAAVVLDSTAWDRYQAMVFS